MDNFGDFGAMLKKLDDLDAKHYSFRCSPSTDNVKSMTTAKEPAADSDMSDFDNSDEDLASLLVDDDDDDVFAKKIHKNSPTKSFKTETPSTGIKTKTLSPSVSFETPPKATSKAPAGKTSSKEDYTDILDDYLEVGKSSSSKIKTATPEKNFTKQKSIYDEEIDFLNDSNTNNFSPSKEKSNYNPIKKTKSIDKQPDELGDLNATGRRGSKAPEERRGSFLDEFLQKLSPRHGMKKTSDILEENKNIEDGEDDILGAYVPTTQKKNETVTDAAIKSPKRRTSLLKQVSFKDLSDDFSETDISGSKMTASPIKDNSFKQKSVPEPNKRELNEIQIKRTEKVDSSKKEDIDWLNYFKDSPQKTPKTVETKRRESVLLEKKDMSILKSKPAMRRQSSADWLGLSDSNMLEEDDDVMMKSKPDDFSVSSTKPSRAKTAPVIRSRRQEQNKMIDDWNDLDGGFLKDNNQPVVSDLSHILKETESKLPAKKSVSSTDFLKDSSDVMLTDTFVTKNRRDSIPKQQLVNNAAASPSTFIPTNVMPSKDIAKAPLDIVPANNFQQTYEQATALHSMQLLLDDSIKERNKLIKENENTKVLLEEKIKTLEEFHKSEKMMLEDSFKTMKSNLKEEFEIKIKSLEERLNLISEEKEKQVKSFEEKLQNILKEHQTEIQRLKDLHSQSINMMKNDHEEALSRLKRLKEQEVEAVLSTQVHSKSLQYLNEQLEARATELASLYNKVEERNANSLKERQALLDAREKDLKALQRRLQKQSEDSEEERTRLQQLVLRLENRLQKLTMEGEEDHWETQQMKAKLTVQQKYLGEEQKLNQYQLEKEKEKLRISQDSLLHEQKTVLLQLAQERQQITLEKIDMQSLAKSIKEEEAKLNMRKLKEESSLQTEKNFIAEERSKLHFEKEKFKEESFELERERDSIQREKQQMRRERERVKELETKLRRKSAELEEIAAVASQEQIKGQNDLAEALSIKEEHQQNIQQHSQQMQMLMEKERHILAEKGKLMQERMEFEQTKNSALCTKCKLSLESPIQALSPDLNMPVAFPIPRAINGLSNQVQHSFVDPNLLMWQIAIQKDREFLQEELAYLKTLKEPTRKKTNNE